MPTLLLFVGGGHGRRDDNGIGVISFAAFIIVDRHIQYIDKRHRHRDRDHKPRPERKQTDQNIERDQDRPTDNKCRIDRPKVFERFSDAGKQRREYLFSADDERRRPKRNQRISKRQD